MRICATSDLHGFFPEIPDCDVLCIAGDIVACNPADPRMDAASLIEFGHWLAALVERGITVIGVAGNHDFILRDHEEFARSLPWIYLLDESVEFGGLKFHGTPWQPWFCEWAFNAPEVDPGEEFLTEKFALIPDDTDVLIAHGPPAGFHDRVGRRNVGSIALNRRIQEIKPKLAIYGHVHHGYGVEQVEGVTLANVSYTSVTNNRYVPANSPMTFEL